MHRFLLGSSSSSSKPSDPIEDEDENDDEDERVVHGKERPRDEREGLQFCPSLPKFARPKLARFVSYL